MNFIKKIFKNLNFYYRTRSKQNFKRTMQRNCYQSLLFCSSANRSRGRKIFMLFFDPYYKNFMNFYISSFGFQTKNLKICEIKIVANKSNLLLDLIRSKSEMLRSREMCFCDLACGMDHIFVMVNVYTCIF